MGEARRRFRTLGPSDFLGHVLRQVTRSWLDTGGLTFFVHHEDTAGLPRQAPGFEIRELFTSNRNAILHGSESGWEKLLARFRSGDRCFGALDGQGLAVHTRWVTLCGTTIPELGMRIVPAENAAYFYDGYTRPDARRRGIDLVVRDVIFHALRAQGRIHIYSYVRNDNPQGLRAAHRAQEVAARVRYLRLFGGTPRVSGPRAMQGAALVGLAATADLDDAEKRASAWHAWFEGWLKEPLARRSIGFHQLPDDAFKAMAEHIRATLSLDPSRDRVLDVGCDSALVTRHVGPHCHRLVGVDFIPGMLIDAQRSRVGETAHSRIPRFAAADGRVLPFPASTFTKAYCTGVVHTLPGFDDALAMIVELIRVVAPGGRVLVAGLPDLRKRGAGRREAWRLGGIRERALILGAIALPARARGFVHRLLRGAKDSPLRYLEFDLEAVSVLLRSRGVECVPMDYPDNFWSRDFRLTRSNLVIMIPERR